MPTTVSGCSGPRSLSAAAIPRSEVTPAACSSAMIGARSAARASARDWRASLLTPVKWFFGMLYAPPGCVDSIASRADAANAVESVQFEPFTST
jgi:hypothetical protein